MPRLSDAGGSKRNNKVTFDFLEIIVSFAKLKIKRRKIYDAIARTKKKFKDLGYRIGSFGYCYGDSLSFNKRRGTFHARYVDRLCNLCAPLHPCFFYFSSNLKKVSNFQTHFILISKASTRTSSCRQAFCPCRTKA